MILLLNEQDFLQDSLANMEPFFTESHTTSYYKNGYTDIHKRNSLQTIEYILLIFYLAKSSKSRLHLKNLEESVHEIRNSVQDLIATVMKNAVSTSNEALDKKVVTTNIANNIDWFCFLIFFSATIGQYIPPQSLYYSILSNDASNSDWNDYKLSKATRKLG